MVVIKKGDCDGFLMRRKRREGEEQGRRIGGVVWKLGDLIRISDLAGFYYKNVLPQRDFFKELPSFSLLLTEQRARVFFCFFCSRGGN